MDPALLQTGPSAQRQPLASTKPGGSAEPKFTLTTPASTGPATTAQPTQPSQPQRQQSQLQSQAQSQQQQHQSEEEASGSDDDGLEDDVDPSSGDHAKRPRLRLAHACDRCRKRKIRCDTQQPCGPCQATKNQCTFHTPSRRVNKPKAANTEGKLQGGIKRPHSPSRTGSGGGLLGGVTGDADRASLEARLAALESMLRDVPPNVHNAFLSSLDARLGSGTSIGLKEGKGEGVGVAPEALLAGGGGGGSTENWGHTNLLNGLNAMGRLSQGGALPRGFSLADATGALYSHGSKSRSDDGVSALSKRMEGMSFFYEDEIGQAKWQGA